MRIIILIYIIAINITALVLYGVDKNRARDGKWRISERTLIGIAVAGGSLGAIIGMHLFHHKTKHWYFKYGLPLIMIIQILIAWLILKKL